jgi:hypothetical protein
MPDILSVNAEVDSITFISDGAASPHEETQVAVSRRGERSCDSST